MMTSITVLEAKYNCWFFFSFKIVFIESIQSPKYDSFIFVVKKNDIYIVKVKYQILDLIFSVL